MRRGKFLTSNQEIKFDLFLVELKIFIQGLILTKLSKISAGNAMFGMGTIRWHLEGPVSLPPQLQKESLTFIKEILSKQFSSLSTSSQRSPTKP